MPTVFIPALMRDLTGGQESVPASGDTVRQVIDDLDTRFPGVKTRLCDDDQLRPGIAVVVDGEMSSQRLRHRLQENSEVHFLPAISGGGQPPAYEAGLADALEKQAWGASDWRGRAFVPHSTLALQAARNEVTGFQVRLRAAHDFVLVTGASNWLHPSGFTPRVRLEVSFPNLPDGAVEVFPVGYVEGDDRRLWMETLLRSGVIEAPAGRVQAVYVRVRVPAQIEPGEYTGQVRLFSQHGFSDEQPAWDAQVTLRVMAAALPAVEDYSFHLNLWQHLTALARFYQVDLWSEAHYAIIDRYYASIAQLGQKVVSIVATEFPWSGQRCYRDPAYPSYLFEHSMISVTRKVDGSLHFDFDRLSRLLDLAAKHHIDRIIDVFGLLNIWVDQEFGFGKVIEDAPDAVRVRCFDAGSGSYTYLRTAEELRQFIRALQAFFEQRGVLDRVRVAADEPSDLAAFNASLDFIRQAAPGFKYSAAINHFEFLEDAPPGVLDFTPILPLACRDPQLTARLTEQTHQKGGMMFWYVCCWPPIPNTFLHSPLPEARLHGWLTHALHLDGFLRWAFCLWPADPWQRVSWRAPAWNAGDMFFVLPGLDGGPVETLRYEALRMAVQDFELLKLVERSLPTEEAQEAIERAFGNVVKAESIAAFAGVGQAKAEDLYSLAPADYHQARQVLFEALERTSS